MEDVLKKIHNTYNDEALFLLNSFPKVDVKAIPTGSLMLDNILGVGGVPRGRYTEIYGVDSSGKTTLCQHIVANAQEQGLTCAYIDVENAMDFDYAVACGVDFDKLYISQPSFADEALGIAEILINSGEVGVVVIDSVAGLSPEKESDGEFADLNVTGMLRAKLLNTFFRRTAVNVRKNNVAVVFTNQMRDNTKSFFGGLSTPGGRGLKHYASVRIELKKKYQGDIKRAGEVVGQEIEVTIKKNKVAPPWGKAVFSIMAGNGIDKYTDTLSTAEMLGVVHKRGSYLVYNDDVIGQGIVKSVATIRDNKDLFYELAEKCKEVLNG